MDWPVRCIPCTSTNRKAHEARSQEKSTWASVSWQTQGEGDRIAPFHQPGMRVIVSKRDQKCVAVGASEVHVEGVLPQIPEKSISVLGRREREATTPMTRSASHEA